MGDPKQKKTRGTGNFETLLPYMRRHWLALGVGFAFMLVQNYGYMKVPGYFQKILDKLTSSNRGGVIFGLLGTAGPRSSST